VSIRVTNTRCRTGAHEEEIFVKRMQPFFLQLGQMSKTSCMRMLWKVLVNSRPWVQNLAYHFGLTRPIHHCRQFAYSKVVNLSTTLDFGRVPLILHITFPLYLCSWEEGRR
jgi:hypothetical protein